MGKFIGSASWSEFAAELSDEKAVRWMWTAFSIAWLNKYRLHVGFRVKQKEIKLMLEDKHHLLKLYFQLCNFPYSNLWLNGRIVAVTLLSEESEKTEGNDV